MVWLHLDAVTALGGLGTCATHLIEGADGGSTASNLKKRLRCTYEYDAPCATCAWFPAM